MPEQVRDIKRRIRSVKSTEQITKAMEMVSAVQLRRAQERVEAARPYAERIRELTARLVGTVEEPSHPLLVPRERKKIGYVVFTADRGLCGAYNAHITRETQNVLKENPDAGLVIVGRKGRDFFRRRGFSFLGEFVQLRDAPGSEQAHQVTQLVLKLYEEKQLDEVNLIFMEYISSSRQRPKVSGLIPVVQVTVGEQDSKMVNNYIFEPDAATVLDLVLPRFVEAQVFQAMFEAKASEHAMRMLSMGAATENAGEMIKQLTLNFNKARQGAITKELAEIVGGAEALKG